MGYPPKVGGLNDEAPPTRILLLTLSTIIGMSFQSRFLPVPKTVAVSVYLSEQPLRSFSWVCRNRLSVARLGMSMFQYTGNKN